MALLRPDPTFYPSPRLAMQAPPERLAYVAALNPPGGTLNDAMLVIDVDPASASYGKRVGQTVLTNVRRRIASLWLECLQFSVVSICATSAYRATLSGCAGNPLFANLRPGYQARSSQPLDRENHRTRGALRTHGIFAPSYRPLWTGGDLYQRIGCSGREWACWHFPSGSLYL